MIGGPVPPPETSSRQETGLDQIRSAYRRRDGLEGRYDPLLPVNLLMNQERTRLLASVIRGWLGTTRLSDIDILEVGCGTGGNLLTLIALGASPERMVGNELLDTRLAVAATRLPGAVRLHLGDASRLPESSGGFDLVIQSLVFSSILDDTLLAALASRMWSGLKPGGMVISYDFAVDNPANADVRGMPVRRLKALFPYGEFSVHRGTVMPPLARLAGPHLYPFLALIPFLKTHRLCAIRKAA